MNLTGIIAISGKPGLFKVVAQGKSNLIVESLTDGKRIPAYSTDRISALEDISVYTYDEDKPLIAVFETIHTKENGGLAPSHKEDKNTLEGYMLEVLPNYDQERVYLSDVKKIFQWYNQLHTTGNLLFEVSEDEKKMAETTTELDGTTTSEEESTIVSSAKKTRAPRKKVEKTVE